MTCTYAWADGLDQTTLQRSLPTSAILWYCIDTNLVFFLFQIILCGWAFWWLEEISSCLFLIYNLVVLYSFILLVSVLLIILKFSVSGLLQLFLLIFWMTVEQGLYLACIPNCNACSNHLQKSAALKKFLIHASWVSSTQSYICF